MSFQLTSSAKNTQLLNNVLGLYMSNDNLIHKNLSFILDIIVNHRLFTETREPSEELASVYRKWTVRLNSLLQSKTITARWCAIVLIRVTCENSHSLLIDHAKTWSAQLLGFIGKAEPVIIHQEAIQTLSFLFSYTADKPELQREVASPNLQRYNQLLLQLGRKEDLLSTVLSALTSNVKCFPSTARHISEPILQLCLSCLDGSRDLDNETVKKANKCLVSLYRAGGKANMADVWRDSLSRLIGSVHDCLNRLFDTIDEETQETELPKSYPFLPVSSDYVDAFPVLLKRIQLVQECISTFLTTSTTIAVGVPVVHLVDLICRIYNVFEGSLMRDYKDKSEFFTLMMCLPALHLSTSKMFTSLLYCSGQEMMRYSKLFSRILLRLLSEHKTKKTLKVSTYKLISLCLEKCGYAFGESIYKQLIVSIIQDLSIVQHKAASITSTTSGQQKKSHKKRKTEVTNSDSLSNKLISASTTEVQVAALETLASLLDVFGFAMENGQRSAVDGTVLTRLIQVIQPSNMSDEEIILVKAGLYQCLIASISHPIETQASILPHATRLFAAGLNDQSHQLQTLCRKGLNTCDLISHARLPPIQRVLPKTSPVVVITAQEEEEEEEVEEEEEEQVEQEAAAAVVEETTKDTVQEKIIPQVREEIKLVPITPVTLPTMVAPTILPRVPAEVVFEAVVEETSPVVADSVDESTLVESVVDLVSPTIELATAAITTVIDDIEDDMDMDMDMPMIDMTGPDSDEDDE